MPHHTTKGRKMTKKTMKALKELGSATERHIPLIATADGSSAGKALVQTNLQLSKMNNKLYRQLRNYDVKFQIHPSTTETDDTISFVFWTLPDTWFVRGAIRHAYNTYMQCMQDELNAGIKMAKWHDFHINEQDPDGVFEYLNVALYDGDGWGTLAADESITDSSVTNTSGTSMGFNILGDESNSFNIFREYAKLINYRVPDDGTISSDQPYDGLLDLKDADVLAERGDKAPYDRDFSTFLPDGDGDDQKILVMKDYLKLNVQGAQGRTTTRNIRAPLGLVWIQRWDDNSATDLSSSWPDITMIATPGSYKGVKAPSLV